MKRWVKRSIVIISAGVLGTLALAMRPALTPDDAGACDNYATQTLPESAANGQPIDIHYSIELGDPAGQTRYIGDISPVAHTLLREAKWDIDLTTANGQLKVTAQCPELHAKDALSHVSATRAINIEEVSPEKQPDGSYHPIMFVFFSIEVDVEPSFLGKRSHTLAVQMLKVDPVAGSVDISEPVLPFVAYVGHHTKLSVRYPVEGLAPRICGTPAEKALTTVLLNLGRVDSTYSAHMAGKVLPEAAEKMLQRNTEAGKPWPECWGSAAPFAEECAKKVVPTLLYLDEKDCFRVKALADFINSPTFARFFGENFADKAPAPTRNDLDPLDNPLNIPTSSIPIEKVDNLGEGE